MPVTIAPILNGESGLSIRAKLNQLIAGAGNGTLGPPLPDEWDDVFDTTPPGVPQNLTLASIVAAASNLKASWDPVADLDLAYYDLQMRENGGAWISFQTSAEEHRFTVLPGVTFDARIRAFDKRGNDSDFSAIVTHISVGDDIPPAMPIGVSATPGFSTVWIEWTPNTEVDLAYYEIYEAAAATPAPADEAVASFKSTAATCVRAGLGDNETWHYWVRAVDTSGNRSPWSARVQATTAIFEFPDIVPPELGVPGVPVLTTAIVVEGGQNVLRINAAFTAGTNAVAYEVGVTEDGGGEIVFAAPESPFSFRARAAIPYVVRVRSVGALGTRSAWTATQSLTPAGDTTAPAVPSGLSATAGIAAIWLQWTLNSENDYSHAEVYENTANDSGTATLIGIAYGRQFARTGLDLDETRYYWLKAVDSSGNKSAFSTVASTTTGSIADPIEVNLVGSGFSTDSTLNRVSWTAGTAVYGAVGATPTQTAIDAGFADWTASPVYVYYVPGNTALSSTTNLATVFSSGGTLVASYRGAHDLQVANGKPIIHGSTLVAGSIGASQLVTGSAVITGSAQIANAIIGNAHITSVSATKIEAGTVLSGEVIVGGRAIGDMATIDVMMDDMTLDRVKSSGTGTGFYSTASGNVVTGSRAFVCNDDAQANWTTLSKVPFDPSKLYKITFKIRKNSGTGGFIYLGLLGHDAAGTVLVAQYVVKVALAQSAVPGTFTNYVGWVKGSSVGGSPSTEGTIAAPAPLRDDIRLISPYVSFNVGAAAGAGAMIVWDSVRIESVDQNTAALVNAGTVKILPGQIEISGSTTLADWRQGGDTTKIAGGSISANTIDANKLTIGQRNVKLESIVFEHNSPSANRVAWTAGAIRYINDAGTTVSAAISANAVGTLWSSGVLYIYWTQGDTSLSTTTDPAVAFGANNVVLATYEGGTNLNADFGRTIVDGSNIKTGTITATQISAHSISVQNLIIGDFNNLIEDQSLAFPAVWSAAPTGVVFETGSGIGYNSNTTRLTLTNIAGSFVGISLLERIPVSSDDKFLLSVVGKRLGAASGDGIRIIYLYYDAAGAWISPQAGGVTWTSADTTDWVRKTFELPTPPANATSIGINISKNGVGTMTGSYAVGRIALQRRMTGELIVDGEITAQKLSTGELITLSAQIKDATILSAKIVSLDAAKIQAGTILSGSVIVGGRSIGDLAAIDTVLDDMSIDRVCVFGTAVGSSYTTVAPTNVVTGSRSFVVGDTGQTHWVAPEIIIPFDPSKLYKVTYKVRRASGTGGSFVAGVRGMAADKTSYIATTGPGAIQQGHWVAANMAQSAISTVLTDYVGWIKGHAATGTGPGTIAVPAKMHNDVRYIQPLFACNVGAAAGAGAVIVVDSIKIETIDENGASLVNVGTVKILPGLIEISGATTLSDWRQGGDTTRIAGGSISANTIDANKLTIGQRNIKVEGLEFEHNSPSANRVSWTAGTIRYYNDAGTLVSAAITAWATGSLWTSGVVYVYWVQGATALIATTAAATAFAANNVVLATYRGGTDLVSDIGRTIIDGSNIKTGTITADRISSYNLTAANAVIQNGLITNAMIGTAAITSSKKMPLAVSRV